MIEHPLDVALTNERIPADPNRPLHCRLLSSQAISLVGPDSRWEGQSHCVSGDLHGVNMVLPGPRHASRCQFDAPCAFVNVRPGLRAGVDDRAMLRLIAR